MSRNINYSGKEGLRGIWIRQAEGIRPDDSDQSL